MDVSFLVRPLTAQPLQLHRKKKHCMAVLNTSASGLRFPRYRYTFTMGIFWV